MITKRLSETHFSGRGADFGDSHAAAHSDFVDVPGDAGIERNNSQTEGVYRSVYHCRRDHPRTVIKSAEGLTDQDGEISKKRDHGANRKERSG